MTEGPDLSRFSNQTVEQLLERAAELEREEEELKDAIKIKMAAACPIKVERIYRVRADLKHPHRRDRPHPYAGRRFYVSYLDHWASKVGHTGTEDKIATGGQWTYVMRASGALERPGKKNAAYGMFNGRFNYKFTSLNVDSLDPTTEEEPPTT